MTNKRFEDLPVWQTAVESCEATEHLLDNEAFRATRGFHDQLHRAPLPLFNNLAERFERGTTSESLTFLYIARSSAGEVRSMLTLKWRRVSKANWPANLKSAIPNAKSLAGSYSRQVSAWADAPQNCDIKGQRHLTAESRQQQDHKKRAAAFQKELLPKLPAGHPLHNDAEERNLT